MKGRGLTLPPLHSAAPHQGAIGSSFLALPFHPLLAGDSKTGSQNLMDMHEVCGLVQGHSEEQREQTGRGG